MISKKLFETIIGFNVIEFEENVNIIRYYPASFPRVKVINWKPDLISLNIFEFAFMCREWALDNGLLEYQILSYSENKKFVSISYKFKNKIIEDFGIYRTDLNNSLFKICEFIQNNKDII